MIFPILDQTKVIKKTTEEKIEKRPASGVSSSVALEALGDFGSNVVQTKEKKKTKTAPGTLTAISPKSLTNSKNQVPVLRRSQGLCPLLGDLLSHSTTPCEYGFVELFPGVCIFAVYNMQYVER